MFARTLIFHGWGELSTCAVCASSRVGVGRLGEGVIWFRVCSLSGRVSRGFGERGVLGRVNWEDLLGLAQVPDFVGLGSLLFS